VHRILLTIALALLFRAAIEAQPTLDAARALYEAKRYPEARQALEKIVAAEPRNAAAMHYLGLTIKRRNDPAALPEAVKWLAKAADLDPKNAIYLGDFGGSSLQLASRTNSISAATKGRDAMEKALALDPDYLDAREGLIQFYQRAPWPIGSSAKAAAHLAELRKRDPDRATVLSVMMKANAKDFTAAFQLCDDVLAKTPDNYAALYQFGRTASISGQHLERGLECLQKCLTQTPPSPASPTHSNVWQRIGNLQERLQRPDDARQAYGAALHLDPGNQQAASALAKLK
jgi:tetratricopeptide (TPR) repeat protein